MTTWRVFVSRALAFVTTRRRDAELREEIQAHLDALTDDYVRRGMSPEQARAAARREFGGVDQMKETYRDQRGLPLAEALAQDVRYAVRLLGRTPGFAVVTILTLAFGIGANTAIFSVVDSVVLRPLTYPQADRLVVLHETFPKIGRVPVSIPIFDEWLRNARSFEQIAIIGGEPATLTDTGEPERLQLARVSPSLFSILGVRPPLGRTLSLGEDVPGRDRVVVMSDDLWRARFGADPGIIGRRITLNGLPYEVVGVMPRAFRFPKLSDLNAFPIPGDRPQLWVPFVARDEERGENDFSCVAKLKPNVSRSEALSELNALQANLARQAPVKVELGATVDPLQDQILGRSQGSLELLWASVSIVLLIACVNVTNLLLARMTTRRREFAIRAAVGADRRRLVRQMLVEGLVLSALAGAAGVAIAYCCVPLILAVAPADVPRLDEVRVDARVLLFAGLISTLAGVFVGTLPAWRLAAVDLCEAMTTSSAMMAGRAGRRLRPFLVGAEVALSAVCLIVSGLLVHSLVNLLTVDRGFRTEATLSADIGLSGVRYSNRETRAAFVQSVLERLRALPGATTVGFANRLPLNGPSVNTWVAVDGRRVSPQERPQSDIRTVDADYFKTLRIPLASGRVFTDVDRGRDVAVISATMAAHVWAGERPIGKRFRLGADPRRVIEVIGVVGDVRGMRLDQQPSNVVYLPYWRGFVNAVSFAVQTGTDPAAMSDAIRTAIHQFEPEAPIAFRTMDQVVADSVADRRFQMNVVLLFAAAALFLAALGVYGVVSQVVAQRTNEMGLRLALGATPRQVIVMVLRDALQIVAGGVAVGVTLALPVGSALRAFLFGVSPQDGLTIAGTCAVLTAAAALAAYVPARRASHVDPVVALRHQ